MRVLGESWCFCNGGGKSERMKATIFSGKAPAVTRINGGGTGFLIHRNLLLTTHAHLPSVAAVEAVVIRLHNAQSATLFPHRLLGLDHPIFHTPLHHVLDSDDFERKSPIRAPTRAYVRDLKNWSSL